MRSYRWIIVTGAVVIGLAALTIAIGAIWLNSFIHSPAFKDEVQSRASQSLGSPVTFQDINFDILHGVKLQGLVTQIDPSHSGGEGALKVNVEQVNLTYSLWDLLVGKLRLTGVTLEKPQIVLTKEPTEPMQNAASASTGNASSTGASSSSSSEQFQFVLDRAKVKDGIVTIQDASGTTTVQLQGINAEANTSGYYEGKDMNGTVRIVQTTASNMVVKDFYTPFTYHANYLVAKPFEASAFSGKLAGGFQMDGTGPSVLDLNANGLNVEQITAATSSGSQAHITGSLDIQSKWRGAESGDPDGEGDAQLSGGKLENVKILQEAASLLRIKELETPDITKAQTHFVVRNRHTKFIGLQVDSPLFRITGDGVVGFDGSLDANLVLALSRDAMGRLPKEASSSFVQQSDGTGSIAFHVSGTTNDPKTDLGERLLMQNTQIKNVINKALNKFFH